MERLDDDDRHDPLARDYDDMALRAIDGDPVAQVRIEAASKHALDVASRPRRQISPGRERLAGTAFAVAAVAGVRSALDDELLDEPAIDIIEQLPARDRAQAVEVIFVPHDPHASVAIVRPWLLKDTARTQ